MDGGVREGKKWEKEREDRLLTSPAVRECGRVRCTQQSRQGRSGVVVRVQYGYGVVQQAQMLDVHAAWTPCIRGVRWLSHCNDRECQRWRRRRRRRRDDAKGRMGKAEAGRAVCWAEEEVFCSADSPICCCCRNKCTRRETGVRIAAGVHETTMDMAGKTCKEHPAERCFAIHSRDLSVKPSSPSFSRLQREGGREKPSPLLPEEYFHIDVCEVKPAHAGISPCSDILSSDVLYLMPMHAYMQFSPSMSADSLPDVFVSHHR